MNNHLRTIWRMISERGGHDKIWELHLGDDKVALDLHQDSAQRGELVDAQLAGRGVGLWCRLGAAG